MTVPTVPTPIVTRIGPEVATAPVVHALQAGAVLAPFPAGVVELDGSGAVACAQGLVTNDIEHAGEGAFVYGASLTPKGMIVVDAWLGRLGTTIRWSTPAEGRERLLAILRRSVPPRLARVTDRSAELVTWRMAGLHAAAVMEAARLPVPAAGRVVRAAVDGSECEIARPTDRAPFAVQIAAPAEWAERIPHRLLEAGALLAPGGVLEFCRILSGWPGLTSEVDERTIPQEVRFDEIGGVSYTKGCYTGQETVSRLHFRGHANRRLQGLEFEGDPGAADRIPIVADGQEVGRVSSVAWLARGEPGAGAAGRWIGLGVLRREIAEGTVVWAGATPARVVDLPFALPRRDPA